MGVGMEREKRLFQKNLLVRKFSIVLETREDVLITTPHTSVRF